MHSALAVFLVFVVPVWDAWSARRLKQSTDPRRKIRAYLASGGWLWAAAAAVWAMEQPGFWFPLRWAPRPGWAPPPMIAAVVCAAFFAGLLAPVAIAWRSGKARARVNRAMAKLSFILPATRSERWLFAGLSVTAGVGEETLYRGFLMRYFGAEWHLGVAIALLITSCVFGAAHGYQGVKGIAATGVVGGIMGLLYVATGSLVAPMALHAAVDLRILLFPADTRAATAA